MGGCRGVMFCDGDCSAPMSMLEDMSKEISSGEDGGLTLGCREWEDSCVEFWRGGMGLMGFFPSSVADISASVS